MIQSSVVAAILSAQGMQEHNVETLIVWLTTEQYPRDAVMRHIADPNKPYRWSDNWIGAAELHKCIVVGLPSEAHLWLNEYIRAVHQGVYFNQTFIAGSVLGLIQGAILLDKEGLRTTFQDDLFISLPQLLITRITADGKLKDEASFEDTLYYVLKEYLLPDSLTILKIVGEAEGPDKTAKAVKAFTVARKERGALAAKDLLPRTGEQIQESQGTELIVRSLFTKRLVKVLLESSTPEEKLKMVAGK